MLTLIASALCPERVDQPRGMRASEVADALRDAIAKNAAKTPLVCRVPLERRLQPQPFVCALQ